MSELVLKTIAIEPVKWEAASMMNSDRMLYKSEDLLRFSAAIALETSSEQMVVSNAAPLDYSAG